MIGVIKGTMRQKKEVNGLPLPIASYKAHLKAPIRNFKVAIMATQSGSGTPAPDNIRPISGVSECNVVRCGKNLLDSALLLGASGWSKDDEGVYSGLNSAMHTYTTNNDVWKIIKPNYQYTMTVKTKSDVEGKRLYFNFYYTDGTVDGINTTSNDTTWQTLTLASNPNKSVEKIQISYNGSAKCYIDDLQLELGSTATAYEAYTGNTYTIQLGDTYYGGELDVTNGVLTVDWGSEDLGNLNYQYNANTNIFTSTNMTNFREPTSTGQRRTGFLCDIYPPSSTVTINANMDDKSMLRLSGQINIRDTSYTSAESFKSAMSGHQLIYSLATPITVQLTPTQIEQLLGTNNVFADTGDVEELEYTDRQVYYGR